MVEGIRLQNVETRAVLTLDMVSTPDFILNSVDWGAVESTHHSFKYVNQIGVYVTGTSLETRSVTIQGWVIAENESLMTIRKTTLNRFFNPQQAVDLFYKDYVLRFLPNTSVRYSTTIAENNEVVCKFKVEGYCPDPLFAEQTESKITAASTQAMFRFPLVISREPDPPGGIVFGLREPSLIVAVTNKGAVNVGMKIVFKASGTLENPSLINVDTQEFFKINKVMQAGEEITVDTIIGEKKIEGLLNGVKGNYFKYRDLDSTWLQLRVGDNLFRYDAEENVDALEVYIYFNNKYLEVQECY
ncbi:MAG: phage tail family protein [Bacteroidaceae bacterium]|nr:phage tail family protein [Bacteroidaceae bacterium]